MSDILSVTIELKKYWLKIHRKVSQKFKRITNEKLWHMLSFRWLIWVSYIFQVNPRTCEGGVTSATKTQ